MRTYTTAHFGSNEGMAVTLTRYSDIEGGDIAVMRVQEACGSEVMIFLPADRLNEFRRKMAEALDLTVPEDAGKPEEVLAALVGMENATVGAVA